MDTSTLSLIAKISSLSYVGIFFVSLCANIFIPVPEEVVLLVLGYLSRQHIFPLYFLIPIVMGGVFIGDIGMYLLSRKNNRIVSFFYNRFFASLIEHKGEEWVSVHIKHIIFFSRFMVQLRFLGPFLAGRNKISIKTFLLYDFFAVCIYVPLFILAGRFFHKKLNLIIYNVNMAKNIFLVIFVLVCLFSITKLLSRIFFKKVIK